MSGLSSVDVGCELKRFVHGQLPAFKNSAEVVKGSGQLTVFRLNPVNVQPQETRFFFSFDVRSCTCPMQIAHAQLTINMRDASTLFFFICRVGHMCMKHHLRLICMHKKDVYSVLFPYMRKRQLEYMSQATPLQLQLSAMKLILLMIESNKRAYLS
jgi:hypothetical protein